MDDQTAAIVGDLNYRTTPDYGDLLMTVQSTHRYHHRVDHPGSTGQGQRAVVTGSGTLLPIRDVIRMASHAYHYLAVFDRHSECPLYLGRTRRTASASQRIMLHANVRGCTFPTCTVPGYQCEVDHITGWANGGPTDIDDLTFRLRNPPQTQNPRRLDRPAQIVGRPHRMDTPTATRTARRRQRLPPPRTITLRGRMTGGRPSTNAVLADRRCAGYSCRRSTEDRRSPSNRLKVREHPGGPRRRTRQRR